MDSNLNNMTKAELIEYIGMITEELDDEKHKAKQRAEEYSSFEKEYEKMLSEKDKELLQLKGKVISQDITLASYKDKVGMPIIVEGDEHDLYKGEQKDLLISLVENALSSYPKYTRSYRILESILSANKKSGTKDKIKDAISVLKSYNGMTKDIQTKLSEVGITVEYDDSKHYKLYFGNDKRFFVALSHSPSDGKCGVNCISDINRMLL